MITKQDLVNFYGFETNLVSKVIRAVPADKLDFTPHEKSSTVKTLLKTFAVEMVMNQAFLKGEEPKESMEAVADFDSIEGGAAEFESKVQEFMTALNALSEEDLQQPMTMWGMTQSRAMFVFMLGCDMIHHRGQLSVYVRLAGGLVPSIYGPSADDDGGFKG